MVKKSLTSLKNGESGIIIQIRDNPGKGRRRRWGFQRRLEDLGLTPGTKVVVVKSAPFNGPVEIQFRGSTLALGRGMAERILLETNK
jgi:Fe2+ transport system protein FeoA